MQHILTLLARARHRIELVGVRQRRQATREEGGHLALEAGREEAADIVVAGVGEDDAF